MDAGKPKQRYVIIFHEVKFRGKVIPPELMLDSNGQPELYGIKAFAEEAAAKACELGEGFTVIDVDTLAAFARQAQEARDKL